MLIRQLEPGQAQRLNRILIAKARVRPLDAIHTMPLMVEGREYALDLLLPEPDATVAVVQALFIEREEEGVFHTQWSDESGLSWLLDLLLERELLQ